MKSKRYRVMFTTYSLEQNRVGETSGYGDIVSEHNSFKAAQRSLIHFLNKPGYKKPGKYFIYDKTTGNKYAAKGAQINPKRVKIIRRNPKSAGHYLIVARHKKAGTLIGYYDGLKGFFTYGHGVEYTTKTTAERVIRSLRKQYKTQLSHITLETERV